MQTSASVGWLYQFLPNVISLGLILVSALFTRPLEKDIDDYQYRLVSEEQDYAKEFAKVMAKNWVAKVGFHSAMIAALASALAALLSATIPNNTDTLGAGLLALAITGLVTTEILWAMYLSKEPTEDLHQGWFSITRRLSLTLIIANLVIIVCIIVLNT